MSSQTELTYNGVSAEEDDRPHHSLAKSQTFDVLNPVRKRNKNGSSEVTTANTHFSGDNQGLQIGHNTGIINVTFNSQSLFASFAVRNDSKDTPTNRSATRLQLRNRARFQDGRRLPQTIEYYAPYPKIKNKETKRQLVEISKPLHFLDCAIAEYFQAAGPSLDQEHVHECLKKIRHDIVNRPGNGSHQPMAPDVYLGDLGSFCEAVAKSWTNPGSSQPVFNLTCRSDDEIFHYLQDSLEVHYWELSLQLFSEWRQQVKSLTEDLVIRVIESVKHEILIGRSRLAAYAESGQDDITQILKGIDRRIRILDSVWARSSSSNSDHLYDLIVDEQRQSQPVESDEDSVTEISEMAESKKETVTLMVLILMFLIAAIIPWSKAFAISWKAGGKGSTEDADFWYLIQSSIMSVLGNLIMVVPLMKKSWLSPAYSMMWLFFSLGLVLAAVSIAIYPFCNTGWSSMAAFFGSIASVSSVLVMTQATAREADRFKVKVN
ncbi:hypothetical protein ACKRZS_004118 [Fusarium odoratissimum]